MRSTKKGKDVDVEPAWKYLGDLDFLPPYAPTPEEVKKRWRDLCKKHHPDVGGSREDFDRIMHAYNMLTDVSYRHRWTEDQIRTKNQNQRGDLNIVLSLVVPFEEGFFGTKRRVNYSVKRFDEQFNEIIGEEEVLMRSIL